MQDNFNDQFDALTNNGEVEQVPNDMFGIKNAQEDPDKKTDKAENKISFSELRKKKKVPRLKKSMVLSILTGGVFAFLIIANLFLQKKEGQKKYFDDQKNNIGIGDDFSLDDLERRARFTDEEVDVITSDDYYLKSPPAYTPVPVKTSAPAASGGGAGYTAPRPPVNSYSDSDLMAMKAQIGKEGGYGLRTVSYAPIEPLRAEPAGYYSQPGIIAQIPTREEYTRQRIDEFARLAQMTGGSGNTTGNKDDNTRYTDAGKYNPNNPQQGEDITWLNDTCLFPGTIIHAILSSRIDTDYPGPIHARVTENVYDSMTGKNLLIPQGTILQGHYSSSAIGVSKVQIAWETMVINYQGSAYHVSLGGMAGVDKRGRSGIAGTLDDHYFEWLKAAGIISLFTMLNSEVSYQSKNQPSAQVRELMDINQGIVNQLGTKLIERALDIQPTVRVANGTAVSVSVNTVVNLRPFPAIKAEEKWIRK